MLIDSHCHIHNADMFGEKTTQKILDNAVKNNVRKIVLIGTDHKDSQLAQDFASVHNESQNDIKNPIEFFWTYGVHPSEFEKSREVPDFSTSRPLAIGEVGLDYHYGPEFYMAAEGEFAEKNLSNEEIRKYQIKLLEEMLDLATKNSLPVCFHVREAFDDFFGVINNFQNVRGVVHSFTDNKKNLSLCLDRGFYIGVNGIATYSTLPLPPLNRILTETDAPYLAPVPHRNETNEPAYIKDIVTWIASQYQMDVKSVESQIEKNFHEAYEIRR